MKDRLHKALEELRYLKKIKNQTDFADKLGYTKTYMSRLMNGHEPITYSIAKEMESVFKLNSNWVLTGDGFMFIETPEQIQQREENKRLETTGRIATGNPHLKVEDLAHIQNNQDKNNSKKAPDGELKKPLKDDGNQLFNGEKDENIDLNLPSHQNDQNMNDLIAAQRDAAKAVLLMAESQKKLVDMLERKLDSMPNLEGIPKGEPLATK